MGRRHMPTENSPESSSRMASGKRASMREGPLAALFRKTEEEGLEGRPAERQSEKQAGPAEPAESRQEPAAAERPATRPRTAEQRLRDVFASDIPDHMMERAPGRPREGGRPRHGREG